MDDRPVQIIRSLVEASLAALGFAIAILIIGSAVALIVRAVYEGVSLIV